MSDDWESYPRNRDVSLTWISFDRGLAAEIALVVPTTCVRLSLHVRSPSPNGMPAKAEFDALNRIEDMLVPFVEERGGIYAGRMTARRVRTFLCYAELPERDIRAFCDSVSRDPGYALAVDREHDPTRRGYWDELFPTEDDDSLIQDMKVFEALRSSGDDGTRPRRIDHWAYFPDRPAAEAFEVWIVKEHGYVSGGIERTSEPATPFQLRFHRHDIPAVGDFTRANVRLRRRAKLLQATYDGWETLVVRDNT